MGNAGFLPSTVVLPLNLTRCSFQQVRIRQQQHWLHELPLCWPCGNELKAISLDLIQASASKEFGFLGLGRSKSTGSSNVYKNPPSLFEVMWVVLHQTLRVHNRNGVYSQLQNP